MARFFQPFNGETRRAVLVLDEERPQLVVGIVLQTPTGHYAGFKVSRDLPVSVHEESLEAALAALDDAPIVS